MQSVLREHFSATPNVEEVHLEHNSIFVVDWEAFRLYKLRRLWLNNNNILVRVLLLVRTLCSVHK